MPPPGFELEAWGPKASNWNDRNVSGCRSQTDLKRTSFCGIRNGKQMQIRKSFVCENEKRSEGKSRNNGALRRRTEVNSIILKTMRSECVLRSNLRI
ncbi:hypothetical protein CEXT_208611 [Caerostris extrusa]|uniref:Uncharacterized protein n=1 Tax=Caerostris extrusa TaxID=172846 RepID=A0AAV4XF21_CAEEX|nr:hypothetical protein CEXT_208611 [Caerostris extrusa]